MNCIDYFFCSGLCEYCITVFMGKLKNKESIIDRKELAKREKDYDKINKIVNS